MAGNVVEIEVTAVNSTKAGFDEAKAQADEAAESLDKYGESAGKAGEASDEAAAGADRLADAQARVGDAADEASAGQDKLAEAQARTADTAKDASDAQEGAAAKTDEAGLAAGGAGSKLRDLALGAGAVAVGALYMGMKFQEGATLLVTGAGQSEKGLKGVEAGMLAVSTQTATSSKDVEAGMYMIESAGYHGAEGLKVLKAAAEGAKVGNANLADMANVVTSALNAYHLPASAAVAVTNQIVASVGAGKMTMQDFASSIANVLPVAASAHLSFAQVGGAMATMTMQGMSARRASMNLANMIRAMISPTAASAAEMKALGLNANSLASNIGKVGLTGTLQDMTDAILRNTSGGSVMLGYMKEMTPAAQGLARGILSGKLSTNDLTTALKGLNPEQAALVEAFEKSATGATGLKQTYDGAMKAMVGGATGLNVALLLGGKNAKTFASNVNTVADSARHAGSDVHGWSDVTKDAGFQLDKAKTAVENTGTAVGLALLPAVEKILGPLADFAGWIARSKVAVDILAVSIGGILAGYAVVKAVSAFKALGSALSAIGGVVTTLAEKLGIMTGATEAQAAATGEAEVAQDGLNLAMLANPITLIIAAIALLVVAFVELWKHCKDFRDFWKDMWRDIKQWAVDAWHAITHAFDNIGHAAGNVVHAVAAAWDEFISVTKKLWHDVVKIVTDLWHDVVKIVTDLWRDYVNLTGRLHDDVVNWFKRIWHDVVSIVLDLWNDCVQGWTRIWHDTVSIVTRMCGDVTSWFRALPGKIVSALGDLGSLLFSAGKSIVEGLIHGVESMFGAVASTAENLVDSLGHKVLSVLGIGSPSKVARYWGQMVGEGLGLGLDDSHGRVAMSAARLAGVALPSGTGGYGGGMAGALQIVVQPGGTGLDQLFINWLKQSIRARGGSGPNSVQRALGQVS